MRETYFKRLQIQENTKIYILMSLYPTGGPEAMHQLQSILKNNGVKTFSILPESGNIFQRFRNYEHNYYAGGLGLGEYLERNIIDIPEYLNRGKLNKFYSFKKTRWAILKLIKGLSIIHGSRIIPERYRKYEADYIGGSGGIEDDERNILIVPEYLDHKMVKKFYSLKKIRKVIWWLSWDNYYKSPCKVFDFDSLDPSVFHLSQSQYAYDQLNSQGIKDIEMLGCYIHASEYGNADLNIKKDQIVYAPKKGFEITKTLLQYDSDLSWIALENMNKEQVKKTFQESKVYVDFGNHPGRDRPPREAALNRCCVIVGKRGSACYQEDVNIPSQYKFDLPIDIPRVIKVIKDCIDNYNDRIKDFRVYRDDLVHDAEKVSQQVKRIFDV